MRAPRAVTFPATSLKSFYKCLLLLYIASQFPGLSPGTACAQETPREKRSALGARALRILNLAMRHDDPSVRVLAAERWGLIGNKAAASLLRRALKDANGYVRIAAAGSLFQLRDDAVLAGR